MFTNPAALFFLILGCIAVVAALLAVPLCGFRRTERFALALMQTCVVVCAAGSAAALLYAMVQVDSRHAAFQDEVVEHLATAQNVRVLSSSKGNVPVAGNQTVRKIAALRDGHVLECVVDVQAEPKSAVASCRPAKD